MQVDARQLDEDRRKRASYQDKELDDRRGAQFMRGIQKSVYLDSGMDLGDRINRNRHQRERHAN